MQKKGIVKTYKDPRGKVQIVVKRTRFGFVIVDKNNNKLDSAPSQTVALKKADKFIKNLRGTDMKESNIIKKIDKTLQGLAEAQATQMECMECGRKFKKKIGPKTYEVKCPKCGSHDTEPI